VIAIIRSNSNHKLPYRVGSGKESTDLLWGGGFKGIFLLSLIHEKIVVDANFRAIIAIIFELAASLKILHCLTILKQFQLILPVMLAIQLRKVLLQTVQDIPGKVQP
jgi:hypothetical protein